MNSMNDSGKFQEVESNYSGRLSYVSCQPAMIPCALSMLSRDKRLLLDTWNTSGLQENVFGNQFSTFDSPRDRPQGIHSCAPQREQGSVPQATGTATLFARDDKQNRDNFNADICRKAVDYEFVNTGGFSAEFYGWTAQTANTGTAIRQTLNPQPFLVWKIRFKNQVTTCSDFPSEAMLWIKEVEMVDSLEELKSSRSVSGKNFPNFEMLDAKIASALNKIIQNSQFNKKVSLEEQKAQKDDRFPLRRQIAFTIYDYFRVTGAHDTVLDYAELFSVTLDDENIQEFDTRWDEILLRMSKIPSDDILESLFTLRIRDSAQLKTALENYDIEIHQKMSMPNYEKLKTIDEKLRLRNFDARHGRNET